VLCLGVNGRRRTTLRATPLRYISLRDLLTSAPESIIHVHKDRAPFGQRQCQKRLMSPIRKITTVHARARRTLLIKELHFPSGCLDIWISMVFRYSQRDWLAMVVWRHVQCTSFPATEATGMFRRLRSPQSLEHFNSTNNVALHLRHCELGCYLLRL
jgi:hypothetical protein